jgi:hypothetical protein
MKVTICLFSNHNKRRPHRSWFSKTRIVMLILVGFRSFSCLKCWGEGPLVRLCCVRIIAMDNIMRLNLWGRRILLRRNISKKLELKGFYLKRQDIPFLFHWSMPFRPGKRYSLLWILSEVVKCSLNWGSPKSLIRIEQSSMLLRFIWHWNICTTLDTSTETWSLKTFSSNRTDT